MHQLPCCGAWPSSFLSQHPPSSQSQRTRPSTRAEAGGELNLAPFPWRQGRRGLDRAFNASQKRLGGYLKRVQLHWSTARYAPWQEAALLDGLADLVQAQQVDELGVSNVGPRRLRWMQARLRERGVELSRRDDLESLGYR